jgi:hypothetical protein
MRQGIAGYECGASVAFHDRKRLRVQSPAFLVVEGDQRGMELPAAQMDGKPNRSPFLCCRPTRRRKGWNWPQRRRIDWRGRR